MSYVTLFYITSTYNYIHLASVTLIQNDQNGEQIQKSQAYFFVVLPNANMLHIYWINTEN